jgi:hypothetical protein
MKKLIGLGLEQPPLRLGFAQRPDKPLVISRQNKSDSFSAQWSVAHARSGWSNLNRTKPMPLQRIELTDALDLTTSRFIEDRAPAALLHQIKATLKKIEASSIG